ncbi:flippase [Vallitalea longa]|uniref:Flippase n=1 Tax=Vallitalea longa TaxID=2936439 RepID=A0A9W5YCX3_9FIRM|nr:oligosaccharide flippase family protein [Vallitalea longa]GKX31765.1 flippase [Vallitalea longa]
MRINQLKAGAVLSYISMGLGYIISIIYTPIMLRLLGQSEYGLYNLVSSVVSYLGLLSFGFGSAYMRYYLCYKAKNDEDNIAKLNGMFLIVFSAIGLITVIVGTIFVFNIDLILGGKLTINELAKSKILVIIMVINIALSFPMSVFNSHITANEKYIFQKLIQMIKIIVNPFIMLPVLLMGYKSIGMVIVTTVLNISIEIANATFCFKKLKIRFSFRHFDFSLMKEMTVFSSFIFINMIIDQINWNVDKFILGRIRGTVAVATYGLAAQFNTYYLSLSTAISNVFIPRVNKIVATTNDNQELSDLFTRIGRLQFILLSLVCSGLIFFGKSFINMWAGADYNESYAIMLLLIIPVTIPLIQNLGIEIQKAKNMHKFRSKVYLFIAILNVLISIPLAKMYGGIGSALGTAISLLIGNGLIMNWYYHKRIGLNINYFWSQIVKFVPSLLLPISVGVLLNMFVELNNVVVFLESVIIYVAVFGLSMSCFGMNKYEKNLISKPIKKIIKKCKKYSQ